jgi:hypothetical protein
MVGETILVAEEGVALKFAAADSTKLTHVALQLNPLEVDSRDSEEIFPQELNRWVTVQEVEAWQKSLEQHGNYYTE